MAMPLLLLSVFLLLSSASANKYNVGDEKGWNPGVNYTLWVNKHRPFHVGDWLVFYYQSGMADIVQVDETAYDKCDASHPISNYSKGRSYAFELNQTKRYYFICSFGYCYQGMKVSVLAHPLPPPSPPPSADHSAARRTRILSSSIAGFAMAAILRFLF
ncbi:lamin-like protein [Dendrobium catenatum]|uniref:Lamin-like protein n=1 Tax=Dendrobium catenatum TaxID=906689 RepID=A0A2I0WHC3_9ASPA|nr:lamin-like protein [Dendrobium catenatum]PKU75064.1 Lamin-like protein [Dendrobium catenatum]